MFSPQNVFTAKTCLLQSKMLEKLLSLISLFSTLLFRVFAKSKKNEAQQKRSEIDRDVYGIFFIDK